MRRSLSVLLILVGSVPGAEVWACSCISHPNDLTEAVQQALDRVDVVFTGKAETVELAPADLETGGQIQTTTFYVLESWKGERSTRIITKINIQCCVCGYQFKEGETYLVFGYERDSGYYSASICGLTSVAEQSKEVISKLRELSPALKSSDSALQTEKGPSRLLDSPEPCQLALAVESGR